MKPPRSVWVAVGADGGCVDVTSRAEIARQWEGMFHFVGRYVLQPKPKPRKRKGAK